MVDEAVLPGNFQDATSQLLTMKQKGVEYAYINVTTTGVSLVLRDAKKLGMTVKFGSNPYGFSESLVPLAGPLAEGVTGVMPHVPVRHAGPGHEERSWPCTTSYHPATRTTPCTSAAGPTCHGLVGGAQARRQGRPADRPGREGGGRDLSRTSPPAASRSR